MPHDVLRRRSPGWVRKTASASLHSLAGTLRRSYTTEGLSERQEWLWDAVISELEYRHRSTDPQWLRCSCEFCIPPFPEPE